MENLPELKILQIQSKRYLVVNLKYIMTVNEDFKWYFCLFVCLLLFVFVGFFVVVFFRFVLLGGGGGGVLFSFWVFF